MVRDITQGRFELTSRDVTNLAAALNLQVDDLSSQLRDDEFNAWAFNSASTRHRLEVWQTAERCWSHERWPLRKAAQVLAMSPGRLHDAIDGIGARRLLFPRAVRLSTALQLDGGARAFLNGVPHHWRTSDDRSV